MSIYLALNKLIGDDKFVFTTALWSTSCRKPYERIQTSACCNKSVMYDVNGLVATCVFSAVFPALKGSHARVLFPVRVFYKQHCRTMLEDTANHSIGNKQ